MGKKNTKKLLLETFAFTIIALISDISKKSEAFPIYAQQAYENPREANGRIVCANCHLAEMPVELKIPISILPNAIFEALVKIPYDTKKKQILENGQKGDLNVGAIAILPEGFKLAPKARLDEIVIGKIRKASITPYSTNRENVLVVGPLNGLKNKEITFPLLSPDPTINKDIYFARYPIYVGANRGRAQITPAGNRTNNNIIAAVASGRIMTLLDKGKENLIRIITKTGEIKEQVISKGISLIIKENQLIKEDDLITENPNFGGFGQTEVEIVLQDPKRVINFVLFCFIIIFTQSIFVLKKKQFEKVQAAELDF